MSTTDQKLTTERRQLIEARLARYNIPLQILEMVADQCGARLDTKSAGNGMPKRNKLEAMFPSLNDKAVIMLEQIFLECRDSLSEFRLAVFLSSKHGAMTHKFVMDQKLVGNSGEAFQFDVCVYNRAGGTLTAIAMQNNSADKQPSNRKSIAAFLAAVRDVKSAHPTVRAAYYSSSYGYEGESLERLGKGKAEQEGVEIQFFEYDDKMYFNATM